MARKKSKKIPHFKSKKSGSKCWEITVIRISKILFFDNKKYRFFVVKIGGKNSLKNI